MLDEWSRNQAEPVTARKVAEEQSDARMTQLRARIRASEDQLSVICDAMNGDEAAMVVVAEGKAKVRLSLFFLSFFSSPRFSSFFCFFTVSEESQAGA